MAHRDADLTHPSYFKVTFRCGGSDGGGGGGGGDGGDADADSDAGYCCCDNDVMHVLVRGEFIFCFNGMMVLKSGVDGMPVVSYFFL